MAVIDYLLFANGGGANVEAQSDWNGETQLLANGFQSGIALSEQANKLWRQTSMMATMLAHFISSELNINVFDDGNLAAMLNNFVAALDSEIRSEVGGSVRAYSRYISATGGGTWTAPFTGQIDIWGWGAGGGSADSISGSSASAGAGSGGFFWHQMSVTQGVGYHYVIGAGGARTSAAGLGGTGGTTTWNDPSPAFNPAATGGGGGSNDATGVGGQGSGASILNLQGAPGQDYGTVNGQGGSGGSAPLGGGGGISTSGHAGPGSQPGGGAGGPGGGGSILGEPGGDGAILINRIT